jgi:hypothetical protein
MNHKFNIIKECGGPTIVILYTCCLLTSGWRGWRWVTCHRSGFRILSILIGCFAPHRFPAIKEECHESFTSILMENSFHRALEGILTTLEFKREREFFFGILLLTSKTLTSIIYCCRKRKAINVHLRLIQSTRWTCNENSDLNALRQSLNSQMKSCISIH